MKIEHRRLYKKSFTSLVLQQRYQVTGLFSMAHADYPVICSHRLPREPASLKAASKEIEAFQLFL